MTIINSKTGSFIAGVAMLVAGSAVAETRLSVADAFPSGHYIAVEGMTYWMNRVTELTDDEVQFDYFTSGQMGPLADMLDMAKNQVADITYVPMSSFADRLPLSGVTELPGYFETSVRGTAAFQALLDDYLKAAEFEPEGVEPLFGAMLPPYQVASSKGPIESDDDFQGVRLRTPGGILEIAASELGATAVPMGGPDMYAALQRGTVDATLNAYGSLKGYRLDEVVDAVSDNGSFGSFAFTVVINKEKFDSLSAEIQDAMAEAGDETAVHIAEWMDENERVIATEFGEGGVEIYSIPEEQLTQWNAALSKVAETWAERLDERSMAGSEALQNWNAALESVAK